MPENIDRTPTRKQKRARAERAGTIFGLCFVAVIVILLSNLISRCSKADEITPAEAAKDNAEHQAALKFAQQQAPLWKRTGSSITMKELSAELSKCRASANPLGVGEVYFSKVSMNDAIISIRRGDPYVTLMGQRRTPIGKVQIGKYLCYFEGAGFNRFQFESVGFIDNFMPD